MAGLNDRINEMLSCLEAIANAASDTGRQAPPARPQPSYNPKPQSFTAVSEPQQPMQSTLSVSDQPAAKPLPTEHASMSADDLIQGVIFAEILGRPVSRRRGRGRYGF